MMMGEVNDFLKEEDVAGGEEASSKRKTGFREEAIWFRAKQARRDVQYWRASEVFAAAVCCLFCDSHFAEKSAQ